MPPANANTAPPLTSATQEPPANKRVDAQASFIKFALKNKDSDAAKAIGLNEHTLNNSQIEELNGLVSGALTKKQGFFSSLLESISIFFECLIGTFTGKCSFNDFSKIKLQRQALSDASKIYERISSNPEYASLAERISGVERDEKGEFRPIVDEDFNLKGIYKLRHEFAADPQSVQKQDQADRGLRASPAQTERMREIFTEEREKLYDSKEVKQWLSVYADNHKAPGADTAIKDFIDSPAFKKHVEQVTERILKDDKIKNSGNYDPISQKQSLVNIIRFELAREYKTEVSKLDLPQDNAPTAARLIAELQQPGERGGYNALHKQLSEATYQAIKPADESKADVQAARKNAVAFAALVTDKFKDKGFAAIGNEMQKKQLKELAHGNKALENLVDDITPAISEALAQYTPPENAPAATAEMATCAPSKAPKRARVRR